MPADSNIGRTVEGDHRPPAPINEPVLDYAPGSAERAELRARLEAMKAEVVEIPLVINGEDVFTGNVAEVHMPHDHGARPRAVSHGGPGGHEAGDRELHGRPIRLGELELAGQGGRVSARGRSPGRSVASDAERGDDARAGKDLSPGRDRCGMRDDRFLAIQRPLRARDPGSAGHELAGHVEHDRLPAARRVHLRDFAVQLHGDRRKPVRGSRDHGQRGPLEARSHSADECVLQHAAAAGGRTSAWRHQLRRG